MDYEGLEQKLLRNSRAVEEFLLKNYDLRVTDEDVRAALLFFLRSKAEQIVESFQETLTTPHLAEHHEFMRLIPKGSIFTGNKDFSFEKMKAVVIFYATVLGFRRLSKTRLNKLAFYSDFYHFKRTGKSISGTAYKHLPHGPVISGYDELLNRMTGSGSIEIVEKDIGEFINSVDGSWRDILTEREKETCQFVYQKFGCLNAEQISEISHAEKAWKNTRNGELISYGFAMLLED